MQTPIGLRGHAPPGIAATAVRGALAPLRFLLLLLLGSMQAMPALAAPGDAEDKRKPGETIDFAADTMSYDDKGDVVTAKGNVVVARNGYRMRADKAVYDRKSGAVTASGDVLIVDPKGNQALGDTAKLNESLKDALIENLLLVLKDGGRAAARSGRRVDGVSTLDHAVYSPCSVMKGCEEVAPVWEIRAVRVVHDPDKKRLYYHGAQIDILGVPIVYLPRFSHPDGGGGNSGGFLTPDVRIDKVLGGTLVTPYYLPLKSNSDLTITPYLFTNELPMLGVEYRQLMSRGPFDVGGLVTYSRQFQQDAQTGQVFPASQNLRGYLHANGTFQLDPDWRVTASVRVTSDTSFLRRYDLTQDDVLRNVARVERIGDDSYLSVEGWAFQGLRVFDRGGQTPIALPLIDWRYRPEDKVLGGNLDFLANTLVVTRPSGEDTQRAIAQARWTDVLTTSLGQRITLTGQVRGDVYHASGAIDLVQQQYAGNDGWNARIIPAAAIDAEWPFAGAALGGGQTITPRVQVVASPFVPNNDIANEDARAIDLTEQNLWDLNRFPGYDRWEGGTRITYGLNYALERPGVRVTSEFGQSYRFNSAADLFPAGTGLTNQFSDYVGRSSVQFGSLVELTDRYRFDRGSLALRRNEADLTVGTRRNFVQLAYTRLDRNLAIEELSNLQEVRAASRAQVTKYWSVFAAAILDLDARADQVLPFEKSSFQPIRHRFGLAYDDECFSFSFTWRRDYVSLNDNRQGDSFLFRVAFKNLGR